MTWHSHAGVQLHALILPPLSRFTSMLNRSNPLKHDCSQSAHLSVGQLPLHFAHSKQHGRPCAPAQQARLSCRCMTSCHSVCTPITVLH